MEENKVEKKSSQEPSPAHSTNRSNNEAMRIGILILAAIANAVSINLFIVPAGLYTGGILGVSQLIRTFLVRVFGLSFAFDIAGIIYYIVNIPFLIIAHKLMGRLYFVKTILTITVNAVALVLIPIPTNPLVSDAFAAGIIGGGLMGATMGLELRMGACDGGMDLIGVLLVHQKKGASVGNVNLYLNIAVFVVMAFSHPLQTVIYSIACSFVTAYSLDHFFTQNINVEVHIVVKGDPEPLIHAIQTQLRRTVTMWNAIGTYSGSEEKILFCILDKYELPRLRRLVRETQPGAFVVENQGVNIQGYFEKHLT
ncbi:MAG: YitT family protein [Eubacterium sp.]|nr:YitT family protein [Eubacterium sp.]